MATMNKVRLLKEDVEAGFGVEHLDIRREALRNYRRAEREAWTRISAETSLSSSEGMEQVAGAVATYADLMLIHWQERYSLEVPEFPEKP